MYVNRKTKDTVFTKLFGEPKYAFQLYKVFHPEDTESTEDELKIITIENVFSNGEHNDLGILMNNHLMLFVEAQSSWNGNMAIRLMLYLAETYKRYFIENEIDIMGRTPVKIPVPEIYVIFTGERKNEPDEVKLSDHFIKDNLNIEFGKNSLELIVKMIYDSNEGDIVYQYINFCKVFNAQMILYPSDKEKASKETLRICLNKSLLDEFIKKHVSEVYDIMSDYLFNEELLNEIHFKSEMRIARTKGLEEGRAEGLAEGLAEGRAKGLEQGLEQGRTEGLEQGRAEGLAEGLAEGITKGQEKAKLEMAKKMLVEGISLETIMRCTDLTQEQLATL